jgi:hypothetical protein
MDTTHQEPATSNEGFASRCCCKNHHVVVYNQAGVILSPKGEGSAPLQFPPQRDGA